MNILLSWLAHNNDFNSDPEAKEKVSTEGPTYQLHKHLYEQIGCDRHIVLSGSGTDDPRLGHLVSKLKRDFKKHDIEGDAIRLKDPIDINEIKSKVESYLLKLKADRIDLFISPGTPSMQTAWYICHSTLGLNTRLFQTRAAKHTRNKDKPELVEVKVETSSVPVTAILSQGRLDQEDDEGGYLITPSLKPVYKQARKVADTDRVNVLITGATGTGKEHLARYIHEHSARKTQPYITVNCSALNDQLLESRLFGYKKGAFTGAEKDTPGLFEMAQHGTLFMDEVGDISPYMQQALLRVLQEQEIQPIGGVPKKVDVRVIAATHRDLQQEIQAGRFRQDLFYRLSTFNIRLPGLAERGGDIVLLAQIFIERFAARMGKVITGMQEDVKEKLMAYSWPGHVRELRNMIERACILCDGPLLDMASLPLEVQSAPMDGPRTKAFDLESVEQEHIRRVLHHTGGNKTLAAELLGIGLTTLYAKVRRYRI